MATAAATDLSWSQPALKPRVNPWIIALTVTLATFMEVLDSSIANVALPHIAGSLGASSEESTWVITSYLVSSAIVLPLSGWLSNMIGRKRFYMSCVAIFTASSVMCGLAPSLPLLIIFRVIQGAGGGGLQPSEQAILADTFSEKQRGMAFAIWGMAIVVAPAIGPTLGGWITDNYSWHWIFFINLPVGLLSLFLTNRLVEDPPYIKARKKSGIKIDYIGIALIVVGVGFLQFVLDKGQELDWFSSRPITISFIISIVALIWMVWRETHHPDPIIDLRLLGLRNFGTAVLFSFVLGIVLNGSTILLPQFLQNILGYTAERAGLALSPGGVALAIMMPVAGILATRFDPRLIVAIGFTLTSFGLFHVTGIYLGIDFDHMIWFRVIQVFGIPLIFIPISTLNYIGVPREKNNQVSGISNFMRNIGGGIGVSLLNNFISRQNQVHTTALVSHAQRSNPFFMRQWQGMTANLQASGLSAHEASHRALAQFSGSVQQQAGVLSFQSAFWVMGFTVMFLIPLPFIMKRPNRKEMKDTAGLH